MLDAIKNWDRELFLQLNNMGYEFWDPFWNFLTEPMTWIPLYAILLVVLYFKLGWRSFLWAVLIITINTFGTDTGSVKLFKDQFERPRPCHQEEIKAEMRLAQDHCGGKYGFVSSHAANTFGMAVLVGLLLRPTIPWMLPVLVIWAAFVSYSRIYLGVHFPLDVICGALYGSIIGTLTATLFYRGPKIIGQ